jgi:tetratricopeptide (TPR) repeat protein
LTRLLNNLAIVHKRLGEYDEAVGLLQETLALKRAIDDELGLPASLANLGNLLVLQGQPEAAAAKGA